MMESYFSSDNKEFVLYQGDSMNLIGEVGKKVDMIFADPPYFLSKNISRCINGLRLLYRITQVSDLDFKPFEHIL